MSKVYQPKLEELMVKRRGSVDPSKFPAEAFELFSIPAFDTGEAVVISGSEIGSSKQNVEPGDLLLSKIVPHIRRAWVVTPRKGYRQIASGEWMIFKHPDAFPDYLRHLLTSDWFHPKLMNTVAGVGGSLVRARPSEIARIEIPLPPLAEQKRIAAILDKADAIRRKLQQSLRLSDDFLRSVFLDMFGDPVTNPKGWKEMELQELGKISTGTTPPSKLENMFGGSIPFITPGDLKEGWISTKRTVTEQGAKQSRIVRKGATLVCCIGATIGKMGKAAEVSAFNQQINAVEWNNHVNDSFGIEVLKFFKTRIADQGMSTTLPILNKSAFQRLTIPVPPMANQSNFAEIIDSLERHTLKLTSQLTDAETLFSSLQQRAFRGKL